MVLVTNPREKQVTSKQAEKLPYSSHIIIYKNKLEFTFCDTGGGRDKRGICVPLASPPPSRELLGAKW